MTINSQPDQSSAAVSAGLSYVVAGADKPVTYQARPGQREQERDAQFNTHRVVIHDARLVAAQFSLESQGFELHHRPSAVRDFYDDAQVRSVYYPEMERLVAEATGATRVVIFDHTVRADSRNKRDQKGAREPARIVHNDYTERSGPQRVRDLLPAGEAEELLQNRFAVVNVWRPINGPVKTAPLALADARSVAARDLVSTDIVYPDRTGEIYYTSFNPEHRWYYFPDMQRDEALLIKCYDSVNDGRARFVIHTAFDDPTSPSHAPPRESIELRTLAFFASEYTEAEPVEQARAA